MNTPVRAASARLQTKLLKLLLFYLLLQAIPYGCSHKPYHKETRLIMGTVAEITCQDKEAINAAFSEMEKIEKIANNFIPESELSALNRQGEIEASPDLINLIEDSIRFYNISGKAFDITVKPVVDIWKERIRKSEATKNIAQGFPLPEEIKEKLRFVGSNKILVKGKSYVKFIEPGMAIDLGGIAKGYAVDKAAGRMRELGVKSAMINCGGNIYCLGRKNQKKWRIGIQHPRQPEKVIFYLDLENQAVATSGDYQQYFMYQGRRFSHIIDPRNGYPADNGIISVTIIADTATEADALSTALFVMGKENAGLFIKEHDKLEAKIVTHDDLQNN